MVEYIPSLACANQLDLAADLRELADIGFTRIHYDIMDGHYVKNFCLSFDTGKQLRSQFPGFLLDVHLMTEAPEQYVEDIAAMGAECITFHPDASSNPRDLLHWIKGRGLKAGLALNPDQDTASLESCLDAVDLILIMSIIPGFPGAQFMTESYKKLDELVCIRNERKLNYKISLDGGISPEAARNLEARQADMLVLGYLLLFNQPEGISGAWRRFMRKNGGNFAIP